MREILEKYKAIFHILSFVPLAHMGVMLLAEEFYRQNHPPEAFLQVSQNSGVVLIGFLTGVAGFSTLMVLLVHAYKHGLFHTSLRVLWIVNLVLFGFVAMPVYFYRYVLNPPDPLDPRSELTQTVKYFWLFLLATGFIFLYQAKVFQPYMMETFK